MSHVGVPPQTSAPPQTSVPPSGLPSEFPANDALPESSDELRHGRGRIWPPLPKDAPIHKRFLRAIVRLVQGLHFHRAMRTAPAMAFHFFLSLLPAIVFVAFIVGAIARRRGVNAIMAPLIDTMPATTEVIVKNQLNRIAGADAHRLGPLAAVGFFWVASSGVHGLMDAVEFTVGARPRKWWKQRLLALGWVVGIIASVGLASFGIIQWDDVVHAGDAPPPIASDRNPIPSPSASVSAAPPSSATWAADDPSKLERPEPTAEPITSGKALPKKPRLDPIPKGGIPPSPAKEPDLTELPSKKPGATPKPSSSNASPDSTTDAKRPPRRSRRILRSEGERVLALVISLAGAVGALAGFYRSSVSVSRRVKRRVFPGAFLAVGLWIVVTWAFGFYVKTLANYAAFYGSLAAVAVLLVWLWLVSLSILVGAELNSQIEGLRD